MCTEKHRIIKLSACVSAETSAKPRLPSELAPRVPRRRLLCGVRGRPHTGPLTHFLDDAARPPTLPSTVRVVSSVRVVQTQHREAPPQLLFRDKLARRRKNRRTPRRRGRRRSRRRKFSGRGRWRRRGHRWGRRGFGRPLRYAFVHPRWLTGGAGGRPRSTASRERLGDGSCFLRKSSAPWANQHSPAKSQLPVRVHRRHIFVLYSAQFGCAPPSEPFGTIRGWAGSGAGAGRGSLPGGLECSFGFSRGFFFFF